VFELGFQHMTDPDIVNAAAKQRDKKRVGRMRVKKKEKVVSASVMARCCSVLTL
jgi:hypothetical protein